jgi:serine/threonine protein kinase
MLSRTQTLRQFHHPHIAKLYGYHLSDDLRSKVCLVFEMAEKGSLDKFWKDDDQRTELYWTQRLQVALDVATALSYLHCGGDGIQACFHRDIKSANICLKDNFRAQLIDCGLAKFVKEEQELVLSQNSLGNSKVGTPGYICPLYQRDAISYCDKCDVYSFGVVLMELIVGRVQNSKDGNSKARNFSLLYVMKRSKNRIEDDFDEMAGEWPEAAKADFAELALDCMHEADEEERPSMLMVVQRLQTLVCRFCRPSASSEASTNEVAAQLVTGNQNAFANQTGYDAVASIATGSQVPSPLVKNTCRQCMIVSDKCLPCNNVMAPHFHCKSCLDCHVRNRIADKEIGCPFEGCRGAPFTDDQICFVAEHNTFSYFLTTRMYNKLFAMMVRNHQEGQATMKKYHNEDMDMMIPLRAGRQERCPRLFVIVEADSPHMLKHPGEWLHRKMSVKARLYFVCAHSRQLVNPPIKLTVSKDWWMKVQPAVNAALLVLAALSPVCGGRSSIPLLDIKGIDDNIKSHTKRVANAKQDPTKAKKLVGKAYELIADKADDDGNFYDTMAPVYKDGEIVWVLKQYKGLYERKVQRDI